ncbi:MAG: M23 family metallopeptidase [Alphaproteobacteria bacterium]|nr:M23 family metallopeptidase [Alphaproteobacteria bacterium]
MPAVIALVLAVFLVAGAVMTAAAQQRRGGSGPPVPAPPELPAGMDPALAAAFGPMQATREAMRDRGFIETGLRPAYPPDAKCPTVTSPFASPTRSDGSRRSPRFFAGLHGGVDIPAPAGTPVLAVASGTVVHVTKGVSIGGIGMVLQHAPDDTGLPAWTYTEYKHLRSMPDFQPGDKVKRGQVIADVGDTGTTGGHYGEEGFTHLHLSAFWSSRPDFQAARLFMPLDGRWLDPIAIFRGAPLDSSEIASLPAARKSVAFAYQTSDGRLSQPEARVIWPLPCTTR